MNEVKDIYGRRFKTLRVSLINTCNLGCIYCTYGNQEQKENYRSSADKALTVGELATIIRQLHTILNLETIRFTGGEPLLYKELPELAALVKQSRIEDLKITTNALLLEGQAQKLRDAGISSINVSLDAIDEDVFYTMSRRSGLNRILAGIEAALNAGIDVKINSVVMKGLNDSQILPLADFAFSKNISIRFLEIMAMGHLYGKADQHFFSQHEILDRMAAKYSFTRNNRRQSSTANYWTTSSGHTFGIVANESEPFCSDCNRLRLDSYGNIYGCLSSNKPISVRNLSNTQLVDKLNEALAQKQRLRFAGSELSMMHIGG